MSKPRIHALSSAKRYGGQPEDYIEVHNLLDSSKAVIADQRHRSLTHNAWFIGEILERIKFSNSCPPTGDNRFPTLINSEGKHVSVRDIGEDHMTEDFHGFIPSAQDYLMEMSIQDWMCNGKGSPPSFAKISEHRRRKVAASRPAPKDVIFDGRRTPEIPDTILDGGRPLLSQVYIDGGAGPAGGCHPFPRKDKPDHYLVD